MEEKTQLRQIADRLGLGEYPEAMEAIFEAQKGSTEPACDLAVIDRLQEKYDLFEEFYDIVKESAEKINADPELNAYVRTAIQFNKESNVATALKLPGPAISGKPELDLMLFHVVMPMIEASFEKRDRLGFTWEEQKDAREIYKKAIREVQNSTGHPGVRQGNLTRFGLYSRAEIYSHAGFLFEIKPLYARALWIRNRQTGQVLPLVKGRIHRDGVMFVGAKGYDDQTDSFVADFSEDEEKFCGNACVNNVTSRESAVYSKKEWECVGRPGEYCLSIHIPDGTDISREATMKACRESIKIFHERFPEYNGTDLIFCATWLLNPKLKQLLGEQSRIVQFADCFVTYPIQDPNATAVFAFVFGGKPDDLITLPEDTSLRRKLKKLFLDGDHLHAYSGVICLKE